MEYAPFFGVNGSGKSLNGICAFFLGNPEMEYAPFFGEIWDLIKRAIYQGKQSLPHIYQI